MKQFTQSIANDEDQNKISKLLDKLQNSINKIEEVGGVVDHAYINHANQHDSQTTAVVYFRGDLKEYEESEMEQKRFTGEGENPTDAYNEAAKLLNEWLDMTKPTDIYDLKFDFYAGKESRDVVEVNIFYSK
jgi:hypothetical protein